MDINEKLDEVLDLVTELNNKIDNQTEEIADLREAVSNLGSGGSGYRIFSVDDEVE